MSLLCDQYVLGTHEYANPVTFETSAALHELIEHVETTFGLASHNHPTLLKQVPVNVSTGDAAIRRETDANEFAKTTRVVIPLSLCVPESLKDRICLQNLTFQKTETTLGSETAEARAGATDRGRLGMFS